MCSIFGFVARAGHTVNVRWLEAIVKGNIARGPHAFGFSWIDGRGTIRCFKQTGRLTDHLPLLLMARDARMLVGHLRWATHGDPSDNANNHPHACDGGWLVHNGVVQNYRQLVRARRMNTCSECDSEAIAHLIETADGPRVDRCVDAVEQTDGNCAILGLWPRPGTFVAVRRGNPLHMARTDTGLYFGSLAAGLPAEARQLADNSALLVTIVRDQLKLVTRKVEPAIWSRDLVPVGGTYRGG